MLSRFGEAIGTLSLELLSESGAAVLLWERTGDQTPFCEELHCPAPWLNATLQLRHWMHRRVKLRFNATAGSSYEGDIAIDDIR